MAHEDTEITLGAGKLLGLFFMLAAVCGIFFAVGFSLGKTSAKEQALQDRSTETRDSPEAAGKSSATDPAGSEASSTANGAAKQPEPDLTFYKAVRQNGQEATDGTTTNAKPAPPTRSPERNAAKPAAATPAEMPGQSAASAHAATTMGAQPQPAASPSGTFLVQIAAVTHEQDAAALAGALRKKSYAAAVVNNPFGKDKLFHVVLGPYASLGDAEAMKVRLQGEGYNPIVKR
jgi:cell division septation protein DedD